MATSGVNRNFGFDAHNIRRRKTSSSLMPNPETRLSRERDQFNARRDLFIDRNNWLETIQFIGRNAEAYVFVYMISNSKCNRASTERTVSKYRSKLMGKPLEDCCLFEHCRGCDRRTHLSRYGAAAFQLSLIFRTRWELPSLNFRCALSLLFCTL